MRVVVDGVVYQGDVVDLSAFDLDGRTVVEAVRQVDGPVTDAQEVVVNCPPPGPVHDCIGLIREGMAVPIRSVLATVARSRGLNAPQDDEIASIRKQLAELELPSVDLAAAQTQVAATEVSDIHRLREEVAAHRGEVQARETMGVDREPASDQLREAAGRLSDLETDKLAAEGSLRMAQERARKSRDAREHRLRLEDRVANLERQARRYLATQLHEEFVTAVDAVPGTGTVSGQPSSFEGDGVTAALAIARIAELDAPIVLACKRFKNAKDASRMLGVPVIRVAERG